MRKVWSRIVSSKRERGAVMFLVAGTTLLVLLMGAVAVDLSITATRGQQLQNAADAAALAGVQAYRNSDGDEAVATAAVTDLLEQNGVDLSGVTVSVEFPDPTHETEVRVVLTDANSGALLTGVTGSDGSVSRNSTARFEKCDDGCNVIVPIRAPFQTLSATGTGDGFVPIQVGENNLYALNHNSSAGAIVCIDRTTANNTSLPASARGRCAGWAGKSRAAYASAQHGPEMPHTAVYGTRIFWTVSNSSSTRLVCFETFTATAGPCASAITLNNRPRATSGQISDTKDQDRGGGTVLVDDLIYAFTDDHRVHCIDPVTMSVCVGYPVGGKSNALRLANFPTNEPINGNHGASIDRIVDESSGRIYSTIHVTNAVPTVACSANMSVPSGRVVIKNTSTNQYLGVNSSTNAIERRTDYNNVRSQWDVVDRGGGFFAFRSANHSDTRVLDADGNNTAIGISTSINTDDEWSIVVSGGSSKIRNRQGHGDLRQVTTSFTTNTSTTATGTNWVIRPWQCEDPAYVPPPTPTLPYAAGTWLHCWDTVTDLPCAGFTSSRIHTNGSRFSGRLFFYRQANTADELGVCSTGYNGTVATANLQVSCVNLGNGLANPSYVTAMASFRTAVAANTNNGPAAWGIPHWNEDTNRMFYPTEHGNSRVVCWDFDTSSTCGSRRAQTALGYIEDYGFFSEGNCIYGLGHNAYFYAFHAEDIFADCAPYAPDTVIHPCECSGSYAWGTLTFDLNLALFNSFLVEIFDQNGNRVWPANPASPPHSLHTNGIVIDLNDVPINNPLTDTLTIEVEIEAAAGVNLSTLGPQTFAISFARAPRLVE